MPARIESPVVVEPIVSDEKLSQLLGLQTEYPELDFKSKIDLSSAEGRVEFAKDAAAMQVRGGFIVGGVDEHGTPTDDMDDVDMSLFDEAKLVPILLKYLPEPLVVRTRRGAGRARGRADLHRSASLGLRGLPHGWPVRTRWGNAPVDPIPCRRRVLARRHA
jgi:hypothetical protein